MCATRVVSRQSPLLLCLSGALGLYVDAKPSFLTPTCFVHAQGEKRRCRLTRRESQRVMNSQGRGQLHPASVVAVHIKYSHRSLPSNADRLQIFNTSRSGTNSHLSPAIIGGDSVKEAEGKISLVSTFTVGICNDQEMPEAPADCMFKGDYLFMRQWSPLPFELFDGLSVPKCDSRSILS